MDNSTAASLGTLVGGIFAVYVLSMIWEWLVFKRVFDDPLKGKIFSVVAAYLTASILYGFVSANGGPFNPAGFGNYLVGLLVVGFFAIRRGLALRDAIAAGGDLSETFE